MHFDYVIVGGGTAGCVLADRLSDDGRHTVCLVEAGPPDRHPFIHLPAGYIKTLFNPRFTWRFMTEPSEGSGGRRIATTQGRTLGGSSSVNGLVYNRGQAADFDAWARSGLEGWRYEDVLPHFKRSEARRGGEDRYRGRGGRLPVTDIDWIHPLCEAFLKGTTEAGIPRNPDYNGSEQEGAGYYQRVISGGRRRSSAVTFLAAARGRRNLTVLTDTQASKIHVENGRAIAVECGRSDGSTLRIGCGREIVVCAGAINSPKLLQLSGIGAAALLQDLGIRPVQVLPGVGQNLRDHWAVRVVARVKNTRTINSLVKPLPLAGEALRWMLGKPSVLGLSPSLAHVFWRSRDGLNSPDLQLTFTPASYKEGVAGLLDAFDGMTCGVWQQRPQSTGFVTARSPDFRVDPLIQPNYLKSEEDQQAIVGGMKLARRLLESGPLAPYFNGREAPGPEVKTDDELLDYARRCGSTVFHLIGTCRMGPVDDPLAVVDPQLRVRGVAGLRIADASVMPTMPSANTMASTYMIAERAAGWILDSAVGRACASEKVE